MKTFKLSATRLNDPYFLAGFYAKHNSDLENMISKKGLISKEMNDIVNYHYIDYVNKYGGETTVENVEDFFECSLVILSGYRKAKLNHGIKLNFSRLPKTWHNLGIILDTINHGKPTFTYIKCEKAMIRENLSVMQNESSLIPLAIFKAACDLFDLPLLKINFVDENLPEIERILKTNIRLYSGNEKSAVYTPIKKKFSETINLLYLNNQLFLIGNEAAIPRRFYCKISPNCRHYTDRLVDLERHEKTCLEQSVQKILSRQKVYGNCLTVLDEMIREEVLPSEAKNYRKTDFCTFDIESLGQASNSDIKTSGLSILSTHTICSVAVGSSMIEFSPICHVRENSSPEAGRKLIENFLKSLSEAHKIMMTKIPSYFKTAENKIDQMIAEEKFGARKTTLFRWKQYIRNYTALQVYGFNCSSFDIPTMGGTFFTVAEEMFGDVTVLKRGSSYLSVCFGNFNFKDILLLSSPCKLSKYLKTWGASESKSIFPYDLYHCVEEFERCKDFPSHADFYSSLAISNVSESDYDTAASEYLRRKSLPDSHPDKMKSMLDWLRYYNLLDVQPFASAISNQFESFWNEFSEDLTCYVSIPKAAETIAYKLYDPLAPYIVSFNDKNNLREEFRKNLIGGLTSVYHRFINLRDDSGPVASRFAPNGDPFTHLTFFDFNSLYLFCQQLPLPTTPGILWEKDGKIFRKKRMSEKTSLGCLQWLTYLQDQVVNQQIENEYFRGEKQIGEFFVDGFLEMGNEKFFYEYNGCRFHHCDRCRSEPKIMRRDTDKFDKLRRMGKLEVMRECEWKEKLETLQNVCTPSFPFILQNKGSEEQILKRIRSGELFGFVKCDVTSPQKYIEDHISTNFPPLIKRAELDESYLSPYMTQICKERETKFPIETVVQSYHAEEHLLFTPLAKFYMEQGLELRNVQFFIQYRPASCLASFANKITEMRMESDREGKQTKGTTAKLCGNSNYGKLLEDPSRHNRVKMIPNEKLEVYAKKAMYKGHIDHETEDQESVLTEVTMMKQKILDDRPIHVGLAILQLSKLKLLTFVNFLEKYLDKNAFKICYVDTDSVALATTRTRSLSGKETLEGKLRKIFLPMISPDKQENFLKEWGKEFVLKDTIQNSRTPGLMKIEFDISKGIFCALSPKTYFVEDDEDLNYKRSSKGIPAKVKLTSQRYIDVLLNNREDHVTFESLRKDRKNNKMTHTNLTKKGLSNVCLKVFVAEDGVTCSPLQKENVYL